MTWPLDTQFLALVFNTLLLWTVCLVLHRYRTRLTLIPFYGFIGALVVYTHTLSSHSINVVSWNLYFHVASTAYFTTLLLAIFLLYLFDEVKAARKGLEIIILISLFQFFVVFITSLEDTKNIFISADLSNFSNYFWSLIAMVIDVAMMAVLWELLSRIKTLPNLIKVPLLIFVVFAVDTLIFATAVFGGTPAYLDILKADFIVRAGLALLMGSIIANYLQSTHYSEAKRIKPEKLWDIVNFKSMLENEVAMLQMEVGKRLAAEKELVATQEKLNAQVKELAQINKYMVDREMKMVELKKEIETLKARNSDQNSG